VCGGGLLLVSHPCMCKRLLTPACAAHGDPASILFHESHIKPSLHRTASSFTKQHVSAKHRPLFVFVLIHFLHRVLPESNLPSIPVFPSSSMPRMKRNSDSSCTDMLKGLFCFCRRLKRNAPPVHNVKLDPQVLQDGFQLPPFIPTTSPLLEPLELLRPLTPLLPPVPTRFDTPWHDRTKIRTRARPSTPLRMVVTCDTITEESAEMLP
jgi:hypothetical protein